MFLSGGSFWVSVSALLFTLVGFFTRILSRIRRNTISQTKRSNFPSVPLRENNRHFSGSFEAEEWKQEKKSDADEVQDKKGDMSKEESPKFFFKFEFQTDTFQKFSKSYRGAAEDVTLDTVPSSSTSKYEFVSGKDSSCFLEAPKDVSFNVRELYADSDKDSVSFCNKEESKNGVLSGIDSTHQNSVEKAILEETVENSTDDVRGKQVLDGPDYEEKDGDVDSGDFRFLLEKDFIAVDSDLDSIASSHGCAGDFLGSISDGFLSDRDFEEAFELDLSRDIDEEMKELMGDISTKHEADDFDNEDRDIVEQLRKLEKSNCDSHPQNENSNNEGNGSNNEATITSDSSSGLDSEGLETLWEHQDFIEQLKMELKKVRDSGLPTILEESECPKIMEDLKPWKIEEKFQQVDRISELHKFYKSYRERMRKFDILNYQKMYAIVAGITSLLPQNLWLGKSKKSEFDPMVKFMRELHTDLEAVYVGQLCLSWEILHWQYEKALELWESDTYRIRRYNEVAGEFQQFQVLMQRFIENEPFEGPRVQNYVKKRCVLRNLLQVPVIREDKEKASRKGKEAYAITSDMLVEIMEESIRIFWRFVRADKDANVVFQKSRKGTQIEPLEPNDLELLSEVQTSLLKKDKKLKELLRSGNCILRKFQKHKEENSDQVLYFFSQVDMKLVARVLNMSKVTTDQLLWCRSKLSRINFVNRKILVEQSFLLFPC